MEASSSRNSSALYWNSDSNCSCTSRVWALRGNAEHSRRAACWVHAGLAAAPLCKASYGTAGHAPSVERLPCG